MNNQIVDVFKALSNETRIDIVRHLLGRKETACKELLNNFTLSQPTLSHHFNILIKSNIINEQKKGTSHFYSINYKYLKKLGIDIKRIVNP